VSDVLVETLVAWGVDTVFGMVGHSNLGFAEALRRAEERGELRYVGIRHEGAAAFAASAYGKLTGRPAVCFAIAGPGSTSLLRRFEGSCRRQRFFSGFCFFVFRMNRRRICSYRFPCIALAYRALRTGGTLPAAMNAANEEAVQAFIDERICFSDIPQIIRDVMNGHATEPLTNLENVLKADASARLLARQSIDRVAADARVSAA